ATPPNRRQLDKSASLSLCCQAERGTHTAYIGRRARRRRMESSTQQHPTSRRAAAGKATPTWPERLLAATAHLLGLFSILGIALAACIWLTQRRRSPYVATQARRAVWWQVIAHLVLLVLIVLLVIVALVTFGAALGTNGDVGQALGTGFVGALAGV